jgi:hypothetical protein
MNHLHTTFESPGWLPRKMTPRQTLNPALPIAPPERLGRNLHIDLPVISRKINTTETTDSSRWSNRRARSGRPLFRHLLEEVWDELKAVHWALRGRRWQLAQSRQGESDTIHNTPAALIFEIGKVVRIEDHPIYSLTWVIERVRTRDRRRIRCDSLGAARPVFELCRDRIRGAANSSAEVGRVWRQ